MYYAHLASNRAVSHIDVAQLDLIRINREKRQGKAQVKGMSDESNTEVPKLLPFEYTNKIHLGMWYI